MRRAFLTIICMHLLLGCSARGDVTEAIEKIATETGYMVEERDGEYLLQKDNTEIAIKVHGGRVILEAVNVEATSKKKRDNQENAGTLQIVPVNNSEIEVYLDHESLLESGRSFPGKIFIVCDYEFEYIRNHRRDTLAKFEKYYHHITNNWATKEELREFFHEALDVVDEINAQLSGK